MSKKITRRFPTLHYDHILKEGGGYVREALEYVKKGFASPDVQDVLRREGSGFCPYLFLLSEWKAPPSAALVVEAMFWYERFGQQNYVLDRAMQAMLNNTSVAGVGKDDIELPFPSFYVVTENSDVKIWGGPDTGFHQMGGMWVTRHQNGVIYLWMWGKPNSKSQFAGDDGCCWMQFDLDQIYKDHADIEAYIADQVLHGKGTNDDDHFAPDDDVRRESVKYYLEAARLAFNLIMYLQTKNLRSETETPEGREATFQKRFGNRNPNKGAARLARRDVDKAGRATVTYLRTSDDFREKLAQSQTGLGRMRWVPGHYQRYWYGSAENKERRWKHKEPYPQNVNASEEVPRRYYVTPEGAPEPPPDGSR